MLPLQNCFRLIYMGVRRFTSKRCNARGGTSEMNARHTRYLMAFVVLLAIALPAMAQWTNGQNAQYVIAQADFTSSVTATTQNSLNNVYGVALDPVNNKLYVADYFNHRVLRFALPITGNQPNAEAVLGQADFTSGSANRGGSVAANTINSPIGLAVGSAGRLWVADNQNHRVLRFESAHTKVNGADADGVLGQADFTSSGAATTQSGIDEPSGVAVDSAGRLWVADRGNNRVLRFENAAAKANGANADGVLGQANYTSGGSALAQNRFTNPKGVAVDSGGRLWTCETSTSRVLRFDNAAGKADGANADGVLGQLDYTSMGSATTQNGMNVPYGVAVDGAGRLYVTDTNNNRVLTFDNAAGKANGASADNVLGQADFTSGGSATSQSGMDTPLALCVDSTNNRLFVVEFNNSRALQFNAGGALPVEMSAFGVE
jgi:sugar lactone lactonase YvrE